MNSLEIRKRYEVRKMAVGEQVRFFNCGDVDLNDFLINEAVFYRKALLSVTYLFEEKSTKQIAAFFSLANDKVSLSDFENKTEFNRFRKIRFINEKRLKSYPAVKLCRLGVDESLKGHHIGTVLLDFIKSFFVVDNKTGCRFLTVDAYADAVPFYMKNGFVPINEEDRDDDTHLLYFDLNDVSGD